ncbi:MAG: NAD(P)/FAD-dependent oxidoreductase, partial [Bacteroidota bacterium]
MISTPRRTSYDAVVVGSGPNGLAAAITIARAGRSVIVFEAKETIGGGTRTQELTLPGYLHDICSAIHPLGVGSPFFRTIPLADHGVEWIFPPVSIAHPLDDGTAVLLTRSIDATAATLGPDADAYRRLMTPIVERWEKLLPDLLGPFGVPRHPLALARFGLLALRSASSLATSRFRTEAARGYFAGLSAHSILPLEMASTAAFGLILGMLGHAVGWPVPKGGSARIAGALAEYLRSLDGEIVVGRRIESIDELPPARAVFFDVTPRQMLAIAGNRLSGGYRKRLERYRYGPGVCKVDWALDGPVPFVAEGCRDAGTVHIGGTLGEIAASERGMWNGEHVERPFVLLAQQSLFDPTRAPEGKQTLWGYCHVPNGSMVDMTERIERQVERFAPGFRERIITRRTITAAAFERYNPNYIGGDINGGAQDLRQLFTRPVMRAVPYSTPDAGIYICSSST